MKTKSKIQISEFAIFGREFYAYRYTSSVYMICYELSNSFYFENFLHFLFFSYKFYSNILFCALYASFKLLLFRAYRKKTNKIKKKLYKC